MLAVVVEKMSYDRLTSHSWPRTVVRECPTQAEPMVTTSSSAAKPSVSRSHGDGYIHNYFDGEDRNETDDWSVRGKLKWDASDDLTLRWS